MRRVIADVKIEDKQTASRVRWTHYVTTDQQANELRSFIAQRAANPGFWRILGNNCADFCVQGLRAAGMDAPSADGVIQLIPNVYYNLKLRELALQWASQWYFEPAANVEVSVCFNGISC